MRIKTVFTSILFWVLSVMLWSQDLHVTPIITPEGNTFDDLVTISCEFPEGCAGGKYWFDGGEIQAKDYVEPFDVDYSCKVSVAGVNKEGHIITDVVTREIKINRVAQPCPIVTPKEGIRKEDFYVTVIRWDHVTRVDLLLDDFKNGGSRYGESVVWLTNKRGQVLATNDFNGLWNNGLNCFKAYLYKDYQVTNPGAYTLHIAGGVFCLDGVVYADELEFQYEVVSDIQIPVFTPESGVYYAPLTVTIEYPKDGSAFYQFYKINGEKAKSYNGPITLTESATIQAYGMDVDFAGQTEIATATYTVLEQPKGKDVLDAPVFSQSGNQISISAQAGVTVKYWFNDNMNTAALYSTPITVSENCKISAVAYRENGLSETADFVVTDFPVNRGDLGERIMITPAGLETIHLRAISANGRWATGFVGSDTSSKGFIWDLTSDEFQFQSSIFVNQLYDIADDGTAYGWRLLSTEVSEDMTDDDMLWGICKEGVWTRQPAEMTVNGITPDGKLFGSCKNQPATYDFTTGSFTYYALPDGGSNQGQITAVSKKSGYLGGYIESNGIRYAVVWKDQHQTVEFKSCVQTREVKVTALSDNGQWAVIGQDYRVNLQSGAVEKTISMSSRYHNDYNPEILTAIADDGTIFGTFDASLISPENGAAMVYTTDQRWRSLTEWLIDAKGGNLLDGYTATSVRAVSADYNVLIMHGRTQGVSSDDSFTRGIALMINVPVNHLAPVSVKAQQVSGLESIKIVWSAPVTHASDVVSYRIKRNGTELATVPASEFIYFDNDLVNGETYSYTVSAVYADGAVSAESFESTVCFKVQAYYPVRHIATRQEGLNDLKVSWDAPLVGMPKLQYFNEDSEWMAFGTEMYNSEFGIRISASELQAFSGQLIRAFQFLPTGMQNSYTLNLYRGIAASDRYESKPFYTQSIDPASLNYGVVNIVELKEPQALPVGVDLYVGLYIETAGNDNMLGVSYEGFKSGYTDLCRIDGVFNSMLPISQNSSQTTEIVLPLGISICDEKTFERNIIQNYLLTLDQQPSITVAETACRIKNLEEGMHTISVQAVYRDGTASEKETVTFDYKYNPAAYVAVDDIEIAVDAEHKATLAWDAPKEDDRQDIHWGDFVARPGLPVQEVFQGYLAGAIYPVTMTKMYAKNYAITELFYYPLTDEAHFEITLSDIMGEFYADIEPTVVVPGKLNYVKLENPVIVDENISYMVSVSVSDVFLGTSPLAFDSSNTSKNGYSNLFDYGMGMGNLSEIVQAGDHPNWILGMVVRQIDADPMPLKGYNVCIDGVKANASLLNECSYTTGVLPEGTHQASVQVIYTEDVQVDGTNQTFVVGQSSAIESLQKENSLSVPCYDLMARQVIADKMGRGLFVISGKKVLNDK